MMRSFLLDLGTLVVPLLLLGFVSGLLAGQRLRRSLPETLEDDS